MKAIVYTKYGTPDVLKLQEVEKPVPGDNDVLVKVYASSVNPLDWHALRGTPLMYRLSGAGLFKPKNKILGADVAGQVEEVGRYVKQFQPGDEVFGDLYWCGFGAFAEYVSVPDYVLSLKPASMTFEEVAAVPQGAITALHCFPDRGRVESGLKVLINGASGGVGVFAVQIAKLFGAEVTGVCSTRNLDMVRSIGADQVIDYTKEDFTQMGQDYDLIIDNVGNRSVSDYKRVLGLNGSFILVGFSMSLMIRLMLLGPRNSKSGNKKMAVLIPKENKEDLAFIKELLGTGKVVPVIDRRYSLSEVAEAIRYLEKGHAKGKVIITV